MNNNNKNTNAIYRSYINSWLYALNKMQDEKNKRYGKTTEQHLERVLNQEVILSFINNQLQQGSIFFLKSGIGLCFYLVN